MLKKKTIKTIVKCILNRHYRFATFSNLFHFYDKIEDEDFVARKFRGVFGRKLNLDSPQTFSEKLQWLKLYDRNPEYSAMVDKCIAKEYVGQRIGYEHIIPTIAVWESEKNIDFEDLPNKFVLKCNHNSGLGMCICKDKTKLDFEKAKALLGIGLNQDYYLTGREWPYKNVSRKIFAEEYLDCEGGLVDYKIHNFNGEPKLILVCGNRFSEEGMTEDFFSIDWEHLDVKRPNVKQARKEILKPKELQEMLNFSRVLSKGVPFLRTDFYIVNHRVYFSELTFFPASGFERFEPETWDVMLGSWLELPLVDSE